MSRTYQIRVGHTACVPITSVPDARRRAIGEALLRVVARDGIDALSLRAVATEADTSLGMVQRQFASKDELLLFAAQLVADAMADRLRRVPYRAPVLGTLRRIVDELLPLDAERVLEARVHYAFVAKAATRPDVAAIVQAQDRELQQTLVSVFAVAEQEGELPLGHDHAALARMLASILDGTSLALLSRPEAAPVDEYVVGVDLALALIQRPPA